MRAAFHFLVVFVVVSAAILLVRVADAWPYDRVLQTGPISPLWHPRLISVVLPCYNCAKTIRQTCKSVEESLVTLMTQYAYYPNISVEIVFVDDKSTDNSKQVIEDIARGKSLYKILAHEENKGPGPARNTGAAAARGDIFLFGDADDDFLPHHVSTCFQMFTRLPNDGFVRTRIDAGPNFHPHWQMAIEDSIPLNLCVRRDAHLWFGGFPEHPEFKEDLEDVAYVKWLYEHYAGSKSLSISVEYKRYEGNMLDKRMQQFSRPPEEVYQTPEEKEINDRRFKIIDMHNNDLSEKMYNYQDYDELIRAHPLDRSAVALAKERIEAFGHAYPIPQAEYTTLQPFVGILAGCRPRALVAAVSSLMYEAMHNPFRIVVFVNSTRCAGAEWVAKLFPVHVVDVAAAHQFPGVLWWAMMQCPISDQIRRMAVFAWRSSDHPEDDLAALEGGDKGNFNPGGGGQGLTADAKDLQRRGIQVEVTRLHGERVTDGRGSGDVGMEGEHACEVVLNKLKKKPSRILATMFHCWSVLRL